MTATVAIVDDDPIIRESAILLFEVSGWVGKPYASGGAFLADLLVSEYPDCAVIDLHMPEMTGAELIEQLVKQDILIPIILLTGDADDPLVNHAINAAVKTVLRKPANTEQLLEHIESAIDQPTGY